MFSLTNKVVCVCLSFQLAQAFDACPDVNDIKSEQLWCLQEMETNVGAYNTTTDNSTIVYSGDMGFSANYLRHDAFSVSSSVDQFDNLFNSLEESSSRTNEVGNSDIGGAVIRRRSREPQNQSHTSLLSVKQGVAPRRIRLQTKLEVGPASCSISRNLICKEEVQVRNRVVCQK